MSQSDTPWNAIIIALSGIYRRPPSVIIDRTWTLVSAAYEDMVRNFHRKSAPLWYIVSQLFQRAAAVRHEQQGNMQTGFGVWVPQLPSFDDNRQKPVCQPLPLIDLPLSFQDSTTPVQPSATVGIDPGLDFDVKRWPLNMIEDMLSNT